MDSRYWADQIVSNLLENQRHVINDSKTPSGRIHIGALRGPIIHDIVYKACLKSDIYAAYHFGCDDFDPLTKVPPYLNYDEYRPFLGKPLRNIISPNPDLSYADFFITDLFNIFKSLNIGAQTYRISDLYLTGQLNEAIDKILKGANTITNIYLSVSGSERPSNWLPINPICERCGKIATTRTTSYDGKQIQYFCNPDGVEYVNGCGYKGSVSPFDGKAKLPWKLEWAARWDALGVTIEGAGKDHIVAGGSRHVAAAVLKEVLHKTPPINIPYEWLLAGGKGMSTSMGIGYSLKEVADNLPPELLRFALVRTRPMKAIEFKIEGMAIPRLFDEYDSYSKAYWKSNTGIDDHKKRVFELSQTSDNFSGPQKLLRFTEVVTLVQIPNIRVQEQAEKQLGALTDIDKSGLSRRIDFAKAWLESGLAPKHVKFSIASDLPDRVLELIPDQKALLTKLHDYLLTNDTWNGEDIHNYIHQAGKEFGLTSRNSFIPIYVVFANQKYGPRAGNLLANLDRNFVLNRLKEAKETF